MEERQSFRLHVLELSKHVMGLEASLLTFGVSKGKSVCTVLTMEVTVTCTLPQSCIEN